MTNISNLKEKTTNGGATTTGILTSTDIVNLATATEELQNGTLIDGNATAGSIGEAVVQLQEAITVDNTAPAGSIGKKVYDLEQNSGGGSSSPLDIVTNVLNNNEIQILGGVSLSHESDFNISSAGDMDIFSPNILNVTGDEIYIGSANDTADIFAAAQSSVNIQAGTDCNIVGESMNIGTVSDTTTVYVTAQDTIGIHSGSEVNIDAQDTITLGAKPTTDVKIEATINDPDAHDEFLKLNTYNDASQINLGSNVNEEGGTYYTHGNINLESQDSSIEIYGSTQYATENYINLAAGNATIQMKADDGNSQSRIDIDADEIYLNGSQQTIHINAGSNELTFSQANGLTVSNLNVGGTTFSDLQTQIGDVDDRAAQLEEQNQQIARQNQQIIDGEIEVQIGVSGAVPIALNEGTMTINVLGGEDDNFANNIEVNLPEIGDGHFTINGVLDITKSATPVIDLGNEGEVTVQVGERPIIEATNGDIALSADTINNTPVSDIESAIEKTTAISYDDSTDVTTIGGVEILGNEISNVQNINGISIDGDQEEFTFNLGDNTHLVIGQGGTQIEDGAVTTDSLTVGSSVISNEKIDIITDHFTINGELIADDSESIAQHLIDIIINDPAALWTLAQALEGATDPNEEE